MTLSTADAPKSSIGSESRNVLSLFVIQRHQHVEGAAAEPHRSAAGQDPETAELRHRGRGRRGELPAMIVMEILKENHRVSEKTPHPGPRSVAGAANLAASGGEVEMPVAAVLVQTLITIVEAENMPANGASVTLNFAPTTVVATASLATVRHAVSDLGIQFFDRATILSFQLSGELVSILGASMLTSNNVVSITFGLELEVSGFPEPPSTVLGLHFSTGTFMILGFD